MFYTKYCIPVWAVDSPKPRLDKAGAKRQEKGECEMFHGPAWPITSGTMFQVVDLVQDNERAQRWADGSRKTNIPTLLQRQGCF